MKIKSKMLTTYYVELLAVLTLQQRITFDLGFSARFCNICADDFIKKGVGFENTESKKNSEALELVEQPLSNTTRSNDSFQEDTQNGYTDTVCDLIFILFTGLLILS